MKELIEFILKSIANHPNEIVVDEQVLPDGMTIYSISANKEDYGRIIGKQGSLIQALRTIVRARAIHDHKRVLVRVMTDNLEGDSSTPTAVSDQAAASDTPSVDDVVVQEALDDSIV